MIDLSILREFDFGSAEYAELLAASSATAFQHPDWLEPFYRILAPAHAVAPHILVGRDRSSRQLQLVLPMVTAGASVEYAFLGVTDYACPVMRPGVSNGGWTAATEIRAALGGRTPVVGPVRLEHVAEWRVLLGVDPEPLPFRAHAMPAGPRGKPHFSGRRRNDLARKARQLGPLRLELVGGAAIGDAFAEAQTFRQGRFEDDPLQTRHGLAFYSEVAARGHLSGLSRTFRLSHEGRTVALLFGLVDGSSFCYIILACNYEQYADFSPGLLIFQRVIERWAQDGGTVFDFTIGDEPYKRELGCTSTPMFRFAGG